MLFTLGYGNIYCKTASGRILTIFYALIGIPLVLTTLNDLGIFIFKLIRKCLDIGEKLDLMNQICRHIRFRRPKPTPENEENNSKVEYELMDLDGHRESTASKADVSLICHFFQFLKFWLISLALAATWLLFSYLQYP